MVGCAQRWVPGVIVHLLSDAVTHALSSDDLFACLSACVSFVPVPLQVSGMLVDLTAGNPLKDAVAQEFMSTLVTSNTHVLESPEGHR